MGAQLTISYPLDIWLRNPPIHQLLADLTPKDTINLSVSPFRHNHFCTVYPLDTITFGHFIP